MSNPVIKIENLGKKYVIAHEGQERYTALRDVIARTARSIFSGKKSSANTKEEFWALKDVSFDVQEGDRIGIIGRNGAGKSTLLKILSRITDPSEGKISINGRIASLLEVGTGFHPELTGRENIFLNGAILGMTRQEIKQNFDAIVDFSGVERFLDTPVKRYSSGMYVRLAFSVAAFLNPEILVIDEVLAVGDAEFQKKCLGKMQDVSEKGKTILFVSHNMDAILRLCNKAVLMKNGTMSFYGDTEKGIAAYMSSEHGISSLRRWNDMSKAPGDSVVRLNEVRVHDEDFRVAEKFDITRPIGISMDYTVLKDGHILTHSFNLYNDQGVHVFSSHDVVSKLRTIPRKPGQYTATMWIPANLMAEGMFTVSAAILTQNPFKVFFHELDAVAFNVYDTIDGTSARGEYVHGFPGSVRPLLQWDTVVKETKLYPIAG